MRYTIWCKACAVDSFLETQTALMVQCMQGWAWRPDRDMKGCSLGVQFDLLIESQDDGPNHDNEDFLLSFI